MIAQYIIDWGYIRQIIHDAKTDSDYDLIRQNLKRIRKAIESNGVLFCDRGKKVLYELKETIKELQYDGDNDQAIPVWKNLSDELEACRKLYDEKRILLDVGEEASLGALSKARDVFIGKSNLDRYDLPYAFISSDEQAEGVSMPLEEYEESEVEKTRERWNRLSFTKGDEAKVDAYFAALSIGASAFGEVKLFDPFCLAVVFRDDPKANLGNWTASIDRIFSFFIRNSHVEQVVFIGFLEDVVKSDIHFDVLRDIFAKTMARRYNHRSNSITCGICAKKEKWHNRWLDVGIAQCVCDDGFELYERDDSSNQTHIRKTFGIGVMGRGRELERREAQAFPCHGYRELYQACNNGASNIIGFHVGDVKPKSADILAEFLIPPPR